jgi:teichuronic acid biosynthesis glycosyltransferase TuaG
METRINLVSIIMPAYNASKTISEAIESVMLQEYSNWELIIVNDGSTDNTLSIIKSFLFIDDRIKLINLVVNEGLPNARNKAINIAQGKYITFLDSDDKWLSNKLKVQVLFHQNNPLVKVSHTKFKMFNEKGFIERPFGFISDSVYKKRGSLFPQFLYKNVIGILTVMIDKELVEEAGGFDDKLWGLEDQDFWIRVSQKNNNFGFINETLALYRISSEGMMKNLYKYKKAYKILINKHADLIDKHGLSKLTWAIYFKYFGTEYYKNNNFRLSTLYFWKSISLSKNFVLNFTTLLYIVKVKLVQKTAK